MFHIFFDVYRLIQWIWVNYNNSLTWIKAIWGWFPLLTMIPVRSQWGRYNLPRWILQLRLQRRAPVARCRAAVRARAPAAAPRARCPWPGLRRGGRHAWEDLEVPIYKAYISRCCTYIYIYRYLYHIYIYIPYRYIYHIVGGTKNIPTKKKPKFQGISPHFFWPTIWY